MTYCVGLLLQQGLVMASDSRTHAGVDNFATFCKMTVFERPGERVLVLLSSGSLAGTQAVTAQIAAIGKYMAYRDVEGYLDYLKDIRQPTLVVQGSNDVIIPTENSYVLQQTLPNAQLILYPDANHGSFYQYPDLFVAEANLFLDR